MYLETLEVGERFRVAGLGKTGTLLGLTLGAALVKYDSDAEVVAVGGKTFTRPGRPTTISRRTEVDRVS
jgi:hypothetical protein